MSELIAEEDALRRYPGLQQLMDARRAGWNFRVIEDDAHRLTGLAASMSRRLLNTSTSSAEIGNLGPSRAPVRKPRQASKIRAAGHVSGEPEWMKTTAAYWREHDFGRGGRPAPGTPLAVSISGFGVPVGITCGRVLPYDGRWVSSSFPVLLMRPGYEPTSVSWMLSATPARNGETLLIATYDLLGCNLADGFDLTGTQVTGRFDTETVILRARRLRLVGGES